MTPKEMNDIIENERIIAECQNFKFSDCVFDNTVKMLSLGISKRINPDYIRKIKKIMKVGTNK